MVWSSNNMQIFITCVKAQITCMRISLKSSQRQPQRYCRNETESIKWMLIQRFRYILIKTVLLKLKSILMTQKYFKTVVYVSLVILVYQGIANSNLGIISQFTHQNGNNWAGPLSTALLFLGSGLGCSYNKYIGKYPFKYCFFVGSLGFILYTALGLIFLKLGFTTIVEVLIFALSFIAGGTCSIFYNTQFNYINFLSRIDKREVKYFGINIGMAQSSNIFGNLVSAMLIKPLGQFLAVLVMTIIMMISAILLLFARQPQKSEMDESQELNSKLQVSQNPEESIISENREGENKRPPETVSSAFIFSGVIISFIYSTLAIIIYQTFEHRMEDTQLNHFTFLIFMFEGVGEFLGGMFVIFFSSKIKNVKKAIIIANTLFILSVAVIYLGSKLANEYIIGCAVVLTGFSDCSSFSFNLTLAGNWKEKGITAFNMRQSITVAFSAILAVFVPLEVLIGWIGCFYLWNMIGFYLYQRSKNKQI